MTLILRLKMILGKEKRPSRLFAFGDSPAKCKEGREYSPLAIHQRNVKREGSIRP
jgi:hypothetical protein